MAHIRHSRWFYAVAGSGVVLGLFSYFQAEKKTVKTAWTTGFEPSVKWDHDWDKRAHTYLKNSKSKENDPLLQNKINEEKVKTRPTAYRTIILVRHGQYEIDAKTERGRILTALGRKQAELVGQRLKDLPFNYTRMVRSTMVRAMETADVIHKSFPNLPIENCDLIQEGFPIQPDPPQNWDISDETCLKHGARIEAAFQKHFHRADVSQTSDSYEIFVCHANVIRYFICRALQVPPEAWLRFALHHCSMTCVVISPSGRVSLTRIGDSGFLPKELLTF